MGFIKRHPIVLIIALCFIAVQIFPISLEGKLGGVPIARSIITLSYFPQKLIFNINQVFSRGWERYIDLTGVKDENEKLKQEIKKLRQEKFRLWEAELQNQRLKKLLEFREASTTYSVVTANVIGGSPSALRSQVVIIDEGNAVGVTEGMPVITNEGIVGRVLVVGNKSSEVVLITDPISAVDAYVYRTRARGVVKGTGDGCVMKYIENKADIAVGDKIVSSGKDGFFPKGVIIGTVVGVDVSGGFVSAQIAPDLKINSLEEVLVVLKSPDNAVLNE